MTWSNFEKILKLTWDTLENFRKNLGKYGNIFREILGDFEETCGQVWEEFRKNMDYFKVHKCGERLQDSPISQKVFIFFGAFWYIIFVNFHA